MDFTYKMTKKDTGMMMNNATAMTPKMFTFAKATSEMDSLAANAGAANAVVAAATDLDNCSAFWETTCCAFCGKDALFYERKKREIDVGQSIKF